MNYINYINCLINPTTLGEAVVVGSITLIMGKLGLYLTLTKEEREKKEQENLGLVFFLIGFILHFLIELIGLNKWYCDKCLIK